MEDVFKGRIIFDGSVDDVTKSICDDFYLGDPVNIKPVSNGYEDVNYIINASKGNAFIKIFSDERTDQDCRRLVDVYSHAISSGVKHPRLLESNQGLLYKKSIHDSDLRLCAMELLEGGDFLSLNQKPSTKEISYIARQAAIINLMSLRPSYIYDSWALVNFSREFKKKCGYLEKEDLKLVEPVVQEFSSLMLDQLPVCFAHNDLTCANIFKDSKNGLWITDLSGSNVYPRVEELAVLACDFCFDQNDSAKSKKNLSTLLASYQKVLPLSEEETGVLPTFIRTGHAMNLLSASFEKNANGNCGEETEYYMNQGRLGLLQE